MLSIFGTGSVWSPNNRWEETLSVTRGSASTASLNFDFNGSVKLSSIISLFQWAGFGGIQFNVADGPFDEARYSSADFTRVFEGTQYGYEELFGTWTCSAFSHTRTNNHFVISKVILLGEYLAESWTTPAQW